MKILLFITLFMIATMAISPVFALQQQSNNFVYNLQLGESETLEWKLINETDEQITVYFSSVNDGKDLITTIPNQIIKPHSSIRVDITVSVPDVYTNNIILKPMLMATQKAVVSSAASTINIAMGAKLTINIGDNPVEDIVTDKIEKVKEKIKEKVEKIEKEGSKGMTINKATPEPIPEPVKKCGSGMVLVDNFCQLDNQVVQNDDGDFIGNLIKAIQDFFANLFK